MKKNYLSSLLSKPFAREKWIPLSIKLLLKLHSNAKIPLFGVFLTKSFNHMYAYALQDWKKIQLKTLQFFNQRTVQKKLIKRGLLIATAFCQTSAFANHPFEEGSWNKENHLNSKKPHSQLFPFPETSLNKKPSSEPPLSLQDLLNANENNPTNYRHIEKNLPSLTAQEKALLAEAIQPEFKDLEADNQDSELSLEAKLNRNNSPEVPLANKSILINFNNVNIIEYIRFISKISNRNFVFDENDLQFNVTILSEEPTSIENVISALIQELNIHGLKLIEQGGNFIIHRSPDVSSVAHVVSEELPGSDPGSSMIITQVFRLNTIDADKVALIIRPMISQKAIIGVLKETNHLILTDLITNLKQVSELLRSLDSPNSGLVVGQYVVKSGSLTNLLKIASDIMEPIAQEQNISFVPHETINSIFVVSTPFLVERTISVLQHLDQSEGATKIFDLHELKLSSKEEQERAGWVKDENGKWVFRPKGGSSKKAEKPPEGEWAVDSQGRWTFIPKGTHQTPFGSWSKGPDGIWRFTSNLPGFTPEGGWKQTSQGTPYFQPGLEQEELQIPGRWIKNTENNWEFQLEKGFAPAGQIGGTSGKPLLLEHGGEPEGNWIFDKNGNVWVFKIKEGDSLKAIEIVRESRYGEVLAGGNGEKTLFYIYKLLYRKGEPVKEALQKLGESLQSSNTMNNSKLLSVINTIQYLQETNSLIITGPKLYLDKAIALIDQLDVPVKQVFIEMLILDTTLADSLKYGVNWGARFGGGGWSGAEAFTSGGLPLQSALATASLPTTAGGTVTIPDASGTTQSTGLNLGIIGRNLTHNGLHFNSLGALVNAVHDNTKTNVVMNPKIIVEDNVSATIFVGQNTSFKTQSVANDLGSIITNNFEFRDVGTTLKVTPHIGANGLITMEIDQEISAIAQQNTNSGTQIVSDIVGPTTNVNRTSTKVHVPNGFFLVISGMITDQNQRGRNQVPCLGGLPFLGAVFSNKLLQDDKRNLMIFIRPQIVDSEYEMDDITKHQQDIFRDKSKFKTLWQEEVDEAFDYLNLKSMDPDDESCNFDPLLP